MKNKKKEQSLKKNYLVEKRNVLTEIRANKMTLQELRFFSIYLSKINQRDLSTRVVRFRLAEFQKIMEIESRINVEHTRKSVYGLLQKIVEVPTEKGGYIAFQLFKIGEVDQDEDGVWYVEIDAHDKALPLMFDFKNQYFTYQLWNALNLKSSNQLNMYEQLKRWQYNGEVVLPLEKIRSMLGIEDHEYARWDKFREKVLNSCQRALMEHTDIKFTYEPIRKGVGRGTGRKITHVKFIIEKNDGSPKQMSLEEFIGTKPETIVMDELANVEPDPLDQYEEHLEAVAEASDFEFSNTQMQVIFNLLSPVTDELVRYRLIKSSYDRLKMYASKNEISNRFGYFEKIVITQVAKLSSKVEAH